MSIEDLAEGTTETEAPVAIWRDTESEEIIFQYGYVSISMPVEDYGGLLELMNEAWKELEGD
ncbi:MAG: hypothetical protein ACOCZX_02610 [Candidatus Bipolaricaulota bacterium]